MEKALYQLKIDPEFEKLIPALNPADLENLAQNISDYGCEDELVVWDGVIVDGHNRYKICQALGIPFAYREIDFKSREEAMKWMIDHSFGRRNMSKFDKAVLGLTYERILAAEAEVRMKGGVKIDPDSNSSQGSEKGKTAKKIASKVGCGVEYLFRVKKILETADEVTIEKLSRDETTVNKVFTRLFPREPKGESPSAVVEESFKMTPAETEGDKTPDNVRVTGNKGVHIEGRVEDEEDPILSLKNRIDDVADNYLVSLEHVLCQYTAKLITEENSNQISSILRSTAQKANRIFKKQIEEESK